MTKFEDAPISDIVADYESGMTVAAVGEKYNIHGRTIHSWLVKMGIPRRKGGTPKGTKLSEERRRRLIGRKRWKMSDEQKKKISEARKSHYNGLNGYGHIKPHNRGYMQAYCPMHPKAHTDGYVMLHTVLMEQHIGRYLEDDEVVHHINHDRADNRIENLMLMKKHEHRTMHMKERYQKGKEEQCRKFGLQAI